MPEPGREGLEMQITLSKHGGQAAAINLGLPPLVVDASILTTEDLRQLAHLVKEAKAAPPAADESSGGARDIMSYTITVDEEGQATVLSQSDTTMSPEFAALLNWIEEYCAGT